MKFFKDHEAKPAKPVCVSNSFEALASRTTLGNMTPDSLFLKLPAELRNMIYRHALEPIHLRTYNYPQQERQPNRHSPLLNIQLTSRQLYHEAREIVFQNGDFHISAHFHRATSHNGRRFADTSAIMQLAAYDSVQDHPITNVTIFIDWCTFLVTCSVPHRYTEDISDICSALPAFEGLKSIKVEWQPHIFEASEMAKRVGIRTNFAFELLFVLGPLRRFQLQHPEISIEMALRSGGPASVNQRYHIVERDAIENADLLDLIHEIENKMLSGNLSN